MKNKIIIGFIAAILFLVQEQTIADKWVGRGKSDSTYTSPRVKAEGCPAAKAYTDLDINNVRCRINTGGDMWWDLQSIPKYEVPKGSKKQSMFSAALWIGGIDVNKKVRVSAQRYRGKGNDFWPGPLTTDGTASVTSETCIKYDKHFVIYRQDVEEFIAWKKDPTAFTDYQMPSYFKTYPAFYQDPSGAPERFLAPFRDINQDGAYDPNDGDYPYYDVEKRFANRAYLFDTTMETFNPLPNPPNKNMGIMADQILKGDQTLWWVFNDKGNRQTESEGDPIGLEIRAQAFSFATNDAINDMTFYSYEIINRSTYRLDSTYFCQWVDPDLGYAQDDYVGCDVGRGLGYCYNGDNFDGSGKPEEYGEQPPTIGVDFFQGPYMDPDGKDNFWNLKDSTPGDPDDNGWNIINGVNFYYPNMPNVTDSIVDNERFGMRRFLYHNNSSGPMGDPDDDAGYYNMLRGRWEGGQSMYYGGDAYNTGILPAKIACDFMFPALTDEYNWGTKLAVPSPKEWKEENANGGNPNNPSDRRFMQSAGPFTLQPGAVNYITVGIPWARAESGGPWASVELLKVVDDKCQRLFDNNFRILNGPDAPDIVVQELDKELILYLTNKSFSNNYKDKYAEYDYNIVSPDSLVGADRYDSIYRFEGYMIYQLKNASVTANELADADKARLIAQCDRRNGISQIINYEYSTRLSADVPVEKVDGEDKGIVHSFRVFNDEFASGEKRLINHKQYYFMAIAYAYNNYKDYAPGRSDCQKTPFLAGRKGSRGQITPVVAIPHIPAVEANGTVLNSLYGTGPKITRIEGQGNGGLVLDLTQESVDAIMSSSNYKILTPEYQNSKGPLRIKVVDPLSVKEGNFTLKFDVDITKNDSLKSSKWSLYDASNVLIATADTTINLLNEQLIMDLGISIQIEQTEPVARTADIGGQYAYNKVNDGSFLESTMKFFGKDSTRWLSGLADYDKEILFNWIRCGTESNVDFSLGSDNNKVFFDESEEFENVINRTWAPYALCAVGADYPGLNLGSRNDPKINTISSIDVFITSDKTKWSRSAVIELNGTTGTASDSSEYNTTLCTKKPRQFDLRQGNSVDKDGNKESGKYGMGWFPGYAINVETGERLNIMFGEDSRFANVWGGRYSKETARDMIWNPTNTLLGPEGLPVFGGKHYVYVMGHVQNKIGAANFESPAYDECQWIYNKLFYTTDANTITNGGQASNVRRQQVMSTAMWVGIPMPINQEDWLRNDVHIRIRVSKPYRKGYADTVYAASPQNGNMPMYTFSTAGLAPTTGDAKTAENALELINVVPNPYFAYASYETDQVDTRVKITNLPEKCTISIYTVNGTLVRQYTRDDKMITSLDWDLKNHAGIPISGGLYLIHVKADGIGEKVIKWFGALRPVDLNSF